MRTLLITVGAFIVMEPITALTHRFVMHGVGVRLHRSHHRRWPVGRDRPGLEANDLYPVMFAGVVMAGLAIGFNVDGWATLVPVGVGITAYGAAYAVVHDVYTHRRLHWFGDHRIAVLDRLAAAHGEHHARNGAPYGMLIPVRRRTGQPATSGSTPSQVPVDATG